MRERLLLYVMIGHLAIRVSRPHYFSVLSAHAVLTPMGMQALAEQGFMLLPQWFKS